MVVSTTFLAMGGSVSLHSVSTPLLTAAGCFALAEQPLVARSLVLVDRIGLKMGKRKIAAAQCRRQDQRRKCRVSINVTAKCMSREAQRQGSVVKNAMRCFLDFPFNFSLTYKEE
ncbi:unnamed protein product [Musa hybrid cultivar]